MLDDQKRKVEDENKRYLPFHYFFSIIFILKNLHKTSDYRTNDTCHHHLHPRKTLLFFLPPYLPNHNNLSYKTSRVSLSPSTHFVTKTYHTESNYLAPHDQHSNNSRIICPKKGITGIKFLLYEMTKNHTQKIFRFFFKTRCDDEDSPVIQEEFSNDSDILPLFDGKVMGIIVKSAE